MIGMELNRDKSEKVKYTFDDYPVYARRGLLSLYPDGKAPAHWHDDIELIAIISGRMNYNVAGEIIELEAGDGVIVNSKHLHYGYSVSDAECDFICILLHPVLLCSLPSTERDFIQPILKAEGLPYIKLTDVDTRQGEILKLIRQIYDVKDQKTAPLLIQSYFGLIWALIYESMDLGDTKTALSPDGISIKNMLEFIMKHYKSEIKLGDIATAGNVGQSKCCKLFAKYTGQTPNAYLNRVRLDESTRYLKETDLTVTAIAREIGFNGASYYAEAFRKRYKKSPTEYRHATRKLS